MIKYEDGHTILNGRGDQLIMELAVIISDIRRTFEENGDQAIELAVAMSKSPFVESTETEQEMTN